MCVQSSCSNKLKCVVCVSVPARPTLVATHALQKNILIETPQLYTLCSGLVTSSASSLTRTNYSNPITSSLGWDHLIFFQHSDTQQQEIDFVLLIQLKTVPLKKIVDTVLKHYCIYYPFKWNTLYVQPQARTRKESESF